MKKFFFALLAVSLIRSPAEAHEGHDHDAPAAVQAPKGGQIKSLETTFVEVVSKASDLRIYFYDQKLNPVAVAPYKVGAKIRKPRRKKTEELALKAGKEHFEASFEAKGLHRYDLILEIKDPREDHGDKLTFTIEPRQGGAQ